MTLPPYFSIMKIPFHLQISLVFQLISDYSVQKGMGEINMSDRQTSYTNGNELVIERIIQAPREKVFQAFSDEHYLAKWWGPQGWETENRVFDFRPNGAWHYGMHCKDKDQGDFYGQVSWGKAYYQEIQAPEKIVYTDVFSDEEGNTSKDMPSTLVSMEFIDLNGSTKLITRSTYDTEETLKQMMEMGMLEGFSSQLERLDMLLEKES